MNKNDFYYAKGTAPANIVADIQVGDNLVSSIPFIWEDLYKVYTVQYHNNGMPDNNIVLTTTGGAEVNYKLSQVAVLGKNDDKSTWSIGILLTNDKQECRYTRNFDSD